MKREFIGRLDTDTWGNPIVDGWLVEFDDYHGRRVRIVIEDVGEDEESYENLAKSFK